MSTRARPTVVAAAGVVVALSLATFLYRSLGPRGRGDALAGRTSSVEQSPFAPPDTYGTGGWKAGANLRKPESPHPVRAAGAKRLRKVKVLLKNGELRPAATGQETIGDAGVAAVIYEGAPPKAVEKLRRILASGSNEYADYTLTEKYPPEVYEKIRGMYPGGLGKILAHMAELDTTLPPTQRGRPYLDWNDDASYNCMYIVGTGIKIAHETLLASGVQPIAETKFGLVMVDGVGTGISTVLPGALAVWLAHRLAAGDTDLKPPRIPPAGFSSWEHWIRQWVGPELVAEYERRGWLAKATGP